MVEARPSTAGEQREPALGPAAAAGGEHDEQREAQVELLLHRERPHVLHGRRRSTGRRRSRGPESASRQLVPMPKTDSRSPRRPVIWVGVAANSAKAVTRTRATSAAGSSRRARADQKRRSEIRPFWWFSTRSSEVMRKPDSVKKVETPRNPPFAQPNPPWYSRTAMSDDGAQAVQRADVGEPGAAHRGRPSVAHRR